MDPERWKQLRKLFDAALALPAPERPGFVARSCEGDPDLERSLHSLLEHSLDTDGSFDQALTEAMTLEGTVVPDPDLVGRTLGRYLIIEKIGEGGMGEVFRATDTDLGRDVAIKIVPSLFARDAERMARFEREARAQASLNHPNIATIHGIESSEGVRYLVLELLEGETLSARLERGALPIELAVGLAVQIASGLAQAHDAGIVHRDLKPANLVFAGEGTLKILDFGLAKAFFGPGNGDFMSEHGRILGTTSFMSPEQARGEAVDHRSDQFALGSVLFEMATGQRAFRGQALAETLSAILREEPDRPPDFDVRVPAPLRRILERCLSKERAGRYESTHELVEDLRGVEGRLAKEAEDLLQAPVAARRKKWLVVTVLAAIVVLAATFFLGSNRNPDRAEEVTQAGGTVLGSEPIRLLILPFHGVGSLELVSQGLTRAVSDGLATNSDLGVLDFPGSVLELDRSVIEGLGERYVAHFLLHASVRPLPGATDRLRADLRLIRTDGLEEISLPPIDVASEDLFRLSERIARTVVKGMQGESDWPIMSTTFRGGSEDPEAYRVFLQARALLESGASFGSERVSELETSLDLFREVVEADPDFADAWARAARASLDLHRMEPSPQRLEEGRRFSERAYELDPDGVAGNFSRGQYFRATGEPEAALRFFDRVVELEPGHARSYQVRASARWQAEQWDGALADIRLAVALSPYELNDAAGRYLFHMRHYDEAQIFLRSAIRHRPDDLIPYLVLAETLIGAGDDPRAAREELASAPGRLPSVARFLVVRYYYLAREFEAALEELRSIDDPVWEFDVHVFPKALFAGLLLERLGQPQEAQQEFLEAVKLLEERKPGDLRTLPTLAFARACLGQREAALGSADQARELLKHPVDQNNAGYQGRQVAVALARLGESVAAVDELRRLLARPSPVSLATIQGDPDFDTIRESESFRELVEELERTTQAP